MLRLEQPRCAHERARFAEHPVACRPFRRCHGVGIRRRELRVAPLSSSERTGRRHGSGHGIGGGADTGGGDAIGGGRSHLRGAANGGGAAIGAGGTVGAGRSRWRGRASRSGRCPWQGRGFRRAVRAPEPWLRLHRRP